MTKAGLITLFSLAIMQVFANSIAKNSERLNKPESSPQIILKKIKFRNSKNKKFPVRNTPLNFVYDQRLISRLYKQLGNYGCWCHFGSNSNLTHTSISSSSTATPPFYLISGSGHPINEIDSICRDYVLAMRCLHKEKESSRRKSDDRNTIFIEKQAKINANSDLEGIKQDCRDFYGEEEEMLVNNCIIERTFTTSVLGLHMSGYKFDASFRHHNFDTSLNCLDENQLDGEHRENRKKDKIEFKSRTKLTNPEYVKKPDDKQFRCCGEYPFRQEC